MRERTTTRGGMMAPAATEAQVIELRAKIDELGRQERMLSDKLHEHKNTIGEELAKIRLAVDRCERPLKVISWVVATVGSVFIGFVVVAMLKMFSVHIPGDATAPPRSGERLGIDHIPEPGPPTDGQHHP